MSGGIGQNMDTCWFYSTLNTFLLSDAGYKVLWKRLQEFYKRLGPRQKAYFNSNLNAPCPRNMTRVNELYFWKFMDEYMCSIGGPGKLFGRANRSRNLLPKIQFTASPIREGKGLVPGYAARELEDILKHIGFTSRDYAFMSGSMASTPIAIWVSTKNNLRTRMMLFDLPLFVGPSQLAGAAIFFQRMGSSVGHYISGVIRNGKGYLFDSDRASEGLAPCSWFNAKSLREYIKNKYGATDAISLGYVIYIRKDYTNAIAPACRRVYKPLNAANEARVQEIRRATFAYGDPLVTRALTMQRSKRLPPAIMARLNQQHGRMTRLNNKAFQGIVNNANSYNGGLATLKNLVRAGYTYNANGPNFKNFKAKLLAKHPRPPPQYAYREVNMVGRNQGYTNKTQYLRALNNYANRWGYVVNRNAQNYKNFVAALNRRFSTRSKRKANNGANGARQAVKARTTR